AWITALRTVPTGGNTLHQLVSGLVVTRRFVCYDGPRTAPVRTCPWSSARGSISPILNHLSPRLKPTSGVWHR
ncbi:MAG: hypothetical protein ACREP9_02745, partial [Candidatus Dormibacteraceae bacterium]